MTILLASNAPSSATSSRLPVHSPDLYFSDGNIILLAGTSPQTAFKVHRSQLARHCEMFADLFSVPQPAFDPAALYDGCPWIELQDDAEDVALFLKAIYDGLYFTNPRAACYPTLSATLRLSTKYLAPHLRERCLHQLSLDYPSTLDGWDRREAEATDKKGRYNPREYTAHPVDIIDLVLSMRWAFGGMSKSEDGDEEETGGAPDVTVVLSSAFYDLSRYGPSRIFAGISSTPSTHAARRPNKMLDTEGFKRTLAGRERAQKFMADFISRELQDREPSKHCAYRLCPSSPYGPEFLTPQTCRESFYFIMLNLLRSIGGIASGRDADPLFTLVQAVEMMERTDFSESGRHQGDGTGERTMCGLKLCMPCKKDFKAAANNAREEVWKALPSWFDLV